MDLRVFVEFASDVCVDVRICRTQRGHTEVVQGVVTQPCSSLAAVSPLAITDYFTRVQLQGGAHADGGANNGVIGLT